MLLLVLRDQREADEIAPDRQRGAGVGDADMDRAEPRSAGNERPPSAASGI